MSKSDLEILEQHGIEPLLGSRAFRVALGNIARETLSRRISRGEVPTPDAVIAGKNYWYPSTIRRAQADARDSVGPKAS
jgi:hypothetical protein